MKKVNLRFLTEAAIMIALSTVLSLYTPFHAPMGGSVTLASMVPLCIIGYRYGFKNGIFVAITASIIQLFLGFENVGYAVTWQGKLAVILFDYIVAFSVYGLSGIFRRAGKTKLTNLFAFGGGIILCGFLRFICHFITGFVLWYDLTKAWYQDDPTNIVFRTGPILYSFLYNISYMLPETIIAAIVGGGLAYFINLKSDSLSYKNIKI